LFHQTAPSGAAEFTEKGILRGLPVGAGLGHAPRGVSAACSRYGTGASVQRNEQGVLGRREARVAEVCIVQARDGACCASQGASHTSRKRRPAADTRSDHGVR
jgi:hypothetical protein